MTGGPPASCESSDGINKDFAFLSVQIRHEFLFLADPRRVSFMEANEVRASGAPPMLISTNVDLVRRQTGT